MDSEDEVYLEEERTRRAGVSIQEIRDSHIPPTFPELRMYLLEEYIAVTKVYLPYARRFDAFAEDVVQRRQYVLRGIPYHVMRLCDTVKGFHKGCLDLSGRHEKRYISVHKRWLVFHAEVKNILKHCTRSWQTVMGPDGKLVRQRNGKAKREQVLVIKPASLRMEFEQRWRLRLQDPVLLGGICEEVVSCMSQHPTPILQRIRLVDLPTELLYWVFELTSNLDVLALGATCKLLRDASLPYVYKARSLDMKRMPSIDWVELERLPSEYDAPFFSRSIKASRDGFLREVEYLRSRKDITNRIEELRVGCCSDIMLELAYPGHDQRQLTFKFSLSRALENVLPPLTNLNWLLFSHVVITSALARTLVSLPQLSTLILTHCAVTSKFRRVNTKSKSMRRFVIQTRHANDVWRLAPFFSYLRDAYVLDIGPGGVESFVEPFGGPLTGFSPSIMEGLTYFRIFNFGAHEWARLCGILTGGGPLRLTHFKLTATHPFHGDFLSVLVVALETAPLEYLVLDGVQCVDLHLFDRLRDAFPSLISLTLKYRAHPGQYTTKPAKWPLPSWEYARAISRFPGLRHFGWNYGVETITYPRALASFESNYADGPIEDDYDDSEADYLQSLFARTCPNIRSFSAGHGQVVFFERHGDVIDIQARNDAESLRYVLEQNPPQDDANFAWT